MFAALYAADALDCITVASTPGNKSPVTAPKKPLNLPATAVPSQIYSSVAAAMISPM